uniref:SGNH hydrolase-type esterase domain-containing protein n=1 Tax=Calcidiscus leptoporus TaxID=127549 RepID=A0A7S0NNL2_9EUKA|mmetsp:Transcript_11502/g.26541  ORF Transcript_11502/g.26541 Transcript_11502/m.26541 type:complete len:275 (+) Transcript_11502:2-826(+)
MAVLTCRACVRDAWRQRNPTSDSSASNEFCAAPSPSLVELMCRVRCIDPALAYPNSLNALVGALKLEEVLTPRAGLPRLSAALVGKCPGIGLDGPLRVCYLGGSVTEQRVGYRPRVTRWLEQMRCSSRLVVQEVPAFCGNCGSKVLAFMVAEWVVARRPHLVIVELAINDGDTLLETEDSDSLGAALEGIVRHVRDALPTCELCVLCMFVRDDLPLHRRTGSKALPSARMHCDGLLSVHHVKVCASPSLHRSPAPWRAVRWVKAQHARAQGLGG